MNVREELLCFNCKWPKALCLFSPSQLKLGKPRCIQCIKESNKRYRLKANCPISFGRSNSFLFEKSK